MLTSFEDSSIALLLLHSDYGTEHLSARKPDLFCYCTEGKGRTVDWCLAKMSEDEPFATRHRPPSPFAPPTTHSTVKIISAYDRSRSTYFCCTVL